MGIFRVEAGLTFFAAIVFVILFNVQTPSGTRDVNPAMFQMVIVQTFQILGGLLAFLATCSLLRQASDSTTIRSVLTTMIALLGGVILMNPGTTVLIIFGTTGLTLAVHHLFAEWLVRRSRQTDSTQP